LVAPKPLFLGHVVRIHTHPQFHTGYSCGRNQKKDPWRVVDLTRASCLAAKILVEPLRSFRNEVKLFLFD
jgi:hypothetical protein